VKASVGSNPTPSAMTSEMPSPSASEQAAHDIEAMNAALEQARLALQHGDVPVGAVVVHEGKVIAARHNERELTGDPTAHAEVLALRDAAQILGRWRLDDCTLVVTLEPCIMCAGGLLNARIGRLVFGAADLKAGATSSLYNVCADPRLNHNPPFQHGVLAEESTALLQEFFAQRR
jgi:tRNA(adenine34) deaminase